MPAERCWAWREPARKTALLCSTAVQQVDYNGSASQQWEVAPLAARYGDQSYYALRAVHSGRTLDNTNFSYKEGSTMQQWGEGGSGAQGWFFEYAGNNGFHIRSHWSTKYLQPANGSRGAGAAVVQTSRKSDLAQKWRLIPVGAAKIEFQAPRAPPD